MVHRRVVRFVKPNHHRGVQVGHVGNVSAGPVAEIALVQFVVEVQEPSIFAQPPLVGVGRLAVVERGNLHHVRFVGHIHDGHPTAAVETKRHFLSCVVRIRAVVKHHLGVVGVGAVIGARHRGGRGIGNVDGVQSAASSVRSHRIRKTSLLVDGDVVCVAEPDVARHGREHLGAFGDLQHLGQIHHLHAVVGGLAHDERVVVVHLDVAPKAGRCRRGNTSHKGGIHRIRDIHDGQPVVAAKQHKLALGRRIHPSPTIVSVGPTPQFLEGAHREQIKSGARVTVCKTVDARGLGKG